MSEKEVREKQLKDGRIIKQRTYTINDTPFGQPRFWCPEKSCVFCKNCTDVIWDYTNGPYMFFCEKDPLAERELTEKGYAGECEEFEDDE